MFNEILTAMGAPVQAPRDPQRRACPGCGRKMRPVHLHAVAIKVGTADHTRQICRRCTWLLANYDRAHALHQRLLAEALAEPPPGDEP
jgi:RNase P subunit RPR2